MVDLIDSNAFRVVVYLLVALLSLWWGVRERRWVATHAVDWWPFYWFMSAALLTAMGIAGPAHSETSSARSVANRPAQAGGTTRDARYLPHVILLSTILAFAAIRLVSLHQVDTVLYRRDVAGVRIVALVELGLLAATVLVTLTTARFPRNALERPMDVRQRAPHTDVV